MNSGIFGIKERVKELSFLKSNGNILLNLMKNERRILQIFAICALILSHALTSCAQIVTQIAAGAYHSLFLKSDGSLWAMGDEEYGQLGDGVGGSPGYTTRTNRPEQIVANDVIVIAAGYGHSLFLKGDGSLWAMGDNQGGALGDGTYNQTTNQPEQIVPANVTAIAGGLNHSLFLKGDGSLWAMGFDYYGQLGDGIYARNAPNYGTNQPELIVASNVMAIAAGAQHSLFLKSDGSLWAMGWNKYGQLGDGTFNDTNLPEMIVAGNVTAIAAGAYHSLFLKSDGSLWAMGGNLADGNGGHVNGGQLGDGTYNNTNQPEMIVASNVTAIATSAGADYSLFLKNDGSLWGMGFNAFGQLGDNTYNNTNLPEKIIASKVMAIAAGFYHSLFIKNDGSLSGMGLNLYGELGDGTYNQTNRPEQILAPYNQISGQLLANGDMQLSFVGIAGANYALDDSTSLSLANWIPMATNSATSYGILIFTNTPDPTINHFWRIRSLP
jgi:alpha-tubulin suppressor-like RCC1 family protein